MGRHALRDGRVDRIFRHIAPGAQVVVIARLALQPTALDLHLMGSLPGPCDDLAHPAHRLAVRRDDRKRPQIVQDVLGGDGLTPDAAFGKGDVLGDGAVEVVADHKHVQMLFDRVDRVGHRRVGRGGDDVLAGHDLHDVGRMAAARAFGMKGVDGAPADGRQRVFNKAGFVQRVGMDHHLHIHLVGDRQAAVDRGGRGAPVLMQLQR